MTEAANPNPVTQLLRRMPYGFYALGSRHGEDANLMVCNWVTQVSFEPQLIAVGLQKTSYSYGLVSQGREFVLNLFLTEDADLIRPFTKSRAKNPEKMTGAKFSSAPKTGAPVLDGAAGYLECQVENIFETGGDHNLVLARVVGAEILKPGKVEDTLNLVGLGWSYAG